MERFGKYELLRKLATGGTAEVFLARAAGPMGFEKVLVIKRILPNLAALPSFVEAFLSEAKLAAKLNHPNVVQIFDFGQHQGMYYIAMEYIDGPTLRIVCRRRQLLNVTLSPAFCARVISMACSGLAHAHGFIEPLTGRPLGILHRDITPENILISRTGVVKVVDFGLARAASLSEHTQVGKFKYMAPERLKQRGALDRRVDVYSLGVVLYELLTGATPFDSVSDEDLTRTIVQGNRIPATALRRDLPRPLASILDRALGPVDQRYPDCVELQEDLESYLRSSGSPMGAPQVAQVLADLGALPEAWTGSTASDLESTRVASAAEITRLARSTATGILSDMTVLADPVAQGMGSAAGATGVFSQGAAGVFPQGVTGVFPRPPPGAFPRPAEPSELTRNSVTIEVRDLRPSFPEEVYTHVHVRNPSLELTVLDGDLPPEDPYGPIASSEVPSDALPPTRELVPPEEDEGRRRWLVPALMACVIVLVLGGLASFVLRGDSLAATPDPAEASAPPEGVEAQPASEPSVRSRERARVRITTSLPASVRVDGNYIGNAPVELKDLEPEEIRVEISNPDLGFRKLARIALVPGDNGTKEITLVRLPVELRVQPQARVAVDGNDLGEIETLKIELYEGWHKIQIVDRKRNRTMTENFIVLPEQANRFSYDLTR